MDGVLDVREERINIRLEKTTAGLGLSIAGGLGSTPFKGDDVGIFVSKVTERGPAEMADLRVSIFNNFIIISIFQWKYPYRFCLNHKKRFKVHFKYNVHYPTTFIVFGKIAC